MYLAVPLEVARRRGVSATRLQRHYAQGPPRRSKIPEPGRARSRKTATQLTARSALTERVNFARRRHRTPGEESFPRCPSFRASRF